MIFSGLISYKFVFTVELLIAEILFLSRLKKRKFFVLRVAAVLAVLFVSVFFFPVFSYDALWGSVIFIYIFVIITLLTKFCFDESWWNLIFVGIAAYTFQHIAYLFYGMAVKAFHLDTLFYDVEYSPYGSASENMYNAISPIMLVAWFDVYFVVYYTAYFVFARRLKRNEDLKLGNVRSLLLAAMFMAVGVVFNMLTEYNSTGNMLSLYLERMYNLLACGLVLYFQFGSLTQKKIASELETVNHLFREKNKQYESVKQNIDIINIKCHDLKQQIRTLKGNVAPDELESIEKAIDMYDASVKTGNEALDVILTEKSLLCGQNGIELLCMADGEKLDFMKPADIYSLFGNAIDNAIEAVIKLEGDDRCITCNVKSVGNIVSVHIENGFAGEVEFENGLPKTSKEDKNYHGYGMRSIKTVVDKYGGEMSVDIVDGVFNLNAVFVTDGI